MSDAMQKGEPKKDPNYISHWAIDTLKKEISFIKNQNAFQISIGLAQIEGVLQGRQECLSEYRFLLIDPVK